MPFRTAQHSSTVPLRIGFVPLIDAAPLIAAHELNYFAEEGLFVVLERQIGWGNVRDKLTFGRLHASHAVLGLSVASQIGGAWFPDPLVTVMAVGSGGNAITISSRLAKCGVNSPATLADFVDRTRGHRRLVFAHAFPYSAHHYLLRDWLAAAGIDPDEDVRLCVTPPPQMVEHLMQEGHLDGFCVGEPCSTVAAQGGGYIVAATTDIVPAHPEKVIIAHRGWASENTETVVRIVRAVLRACSFCADPANATALAEMLAPRRYLNLPAPLLRKSLTADRTFGSNPKAAQGRAAGWKMRSFEAAHTFPSATHCAWIVHQMIRWGHCSADVDVAGIAHRCIDTGPYRAAAASLGIPCPDGDFPPMPLRNGTFDTTSLNAQETKAMKDTRKITDTEVLPSRRKMLKVAGIGAAALLAGLPTGWQGAAWAAESPEVTEMNFGMIALTDCSPIVIAHEKGLFKKYGINSKVTKGASWAAIRDSLTNGDIQATHMLIGMPLASTMGLLGSPKKPMVIPWMLNRNGQCISLKTDLKGKVQADPKALKPIVDAAKSSGSPLTFAMTFPPGTHAMWMRYWLAAGGIHPDKDVSLIVVPPAQMVANMKVGKMDGFCVGEPWNARVVADNIGYTGITTQELWKDHPEKVCAFLAEFAEKNPKTVKAVLKALNEASVWLDDLNNRPEQCQIVSKATYINCPPDIILGRLQGHYDYGDGRKIEDPNYMIFSQRNCNYPQYKYATWWLSQFRRWGMVDGAPDYDGIAKQVMRPDIYEEAMKEIGYVHGGSNTGSETLFDGKTFDPAKPEEYAKSFEIHNLKG